MVNFEVSEYLRDDGILILKSPQFDFDDFPRIADCLTNEVQATVVEKQFNADLYSWHIRYMNHSFLLCAEYYSQSVWLQALNIRDSQNVMDDLAVSGK